jgi:hypothetical protein
MQSREVDPSTRCQRLRTYTGSCHRSSPWPPISMAIATSALPPAKLGDLETAVPCSNTPATPRPAPPPLLAPHRRSLRQLTIKTIAELRLGTPCVSPRAHALPHSHMLCLWVLPELRRAHALPCVSPELRRAHALPPLTHAHNMCGAHTRHVHATCTPARSAHTATMRITCGSQPNKCVRRDMVISLTRSPHSKRWRTLVESRARSPSRLSTGTRCL